MPYPLLPLKPLYNIQTLPDDKVVIYIRHIIVRFDVLKVTGGVIYKLRFAAVVPSKELAIREAMVVGTATAVDPVVIVPVCDHILVEFA